MIVPWWFPPLFFLWILGMFFLWRIPVCRPRRAGPLPTVSVVIPARNEEGNLPRILESLGRQDLRPREILVVDDQSEDRTAEIAAAGGAEVLPSSSLPQGWLGKPWACWQGARAATGELLVFLDADTVLEDGGLGRIVSTWVEKGGLVSIWPFHRMRRLYERLSAFFHIVIMTSMRAFTPLGSRLPPLGAFGPCVVCAREDYFTVGGHEGVRGAILEDVALGQLFAAGGHAVHCLGGRGAIVFRMYPDGVGSLVTGFGKGMATGAQASAVPVLAAIIAWIAGGFIVSFGVTYSLITGRWGGYLPWTVLYVLYVLQLLWILPRIGNYRPPTAVLYPVPALFFTGVFVLSLARTFGRRRVSWKGRSIVIEREKGEG
jgi:4,4'-diaponeurosporenoate glycosyltransferase